MAAERRRWKTWRGRWRSWISHPRVPSHADSENNALNLAIWTVNSRALISAVSRVERILQLGPFHRIDTTFLAVTRRIRALAPDHRVNGRGTENVLIVRAAPCSAPPSQWPHLTPPRRDPTCAIAKDFITRKFTRASCIDLVRKSSRVACAPLCALTPYRYASHRFGRHARTTQGDSRRAARHELLPVSLASYRHQYRRDAITRREAVTRRRRPLHVARLSPAKRRASIARRRAAASTASPSPRPDRAVARSAARCYMGIEPTGRRSRVRALHEFRSAATAPGRDPIWRARSCRRQAVRGPQVGAIAGSRADAAWSCPVVTGVDGRGNPIIISGNHGRRVARGPTASRVLAYVRPSRR